MTEIATTTRAAAPTTISGVLKVMIPELARAVPTGMVLLAVLDPTGNQHVQAPAFSATATSL